MMIRNDLKPKGILERGQAGQLSLQKACGRMGLSYRQARRPVGMAVKESQG